MGRFIINDLASSFTTVHAVGVNVCVNEDSFNVAIQMLQVSFVKRDHAKVYLV
jgi:hypothetical protein